MTWDDVIDRIEQLAATNAEREEDADPITDAAKKRALHGAEVHLRQHDTPPDIVVPGVNGDIVFEWDNVNGFCVSEHYEEDEMWAGKVDLERVKAKVNKS